MTPPTAGRPGGPHVENHLADTGEDTARLLSAWRSDVDLDAPSVDALRRALTSRVLLNRRDWTRIVEASPAAVVGAGVDLLAGGALAGPAADVVMSAVLLHGASGDPAARLVLDHARGRLRRDAG